MLRHAAACFQTPMCSSKKRVLRHAAACCGCTCLDTSALLQPWNACALDATFPQCKSAGANATALAGDGDVTCSRCLSTENKNHQFHGCKFRLQPLLLVDGALFTKGQGCATSSVSFYIDVGPEDSSSYALATPARSMR